MPRRRLLDDDLDSEVDRTFDALELDAVNNRRGSRRVSTGLRTQKDEDEERQKILLEAMNANSTKKVQDPAKNERMLEAMKIAVTKAKQLAARAFQEDLIDRLPSAVEREPLFQAGSLLDASARIYSFRVDATHTEAYDVRSKLGDSSQATDGAGKGGKKDMDDSNEDDEENNGQGSSDEKTDKEQDKDKCKKKRGKEVESDSDGELSDENDSKKNELYSADDLPVYVDDQESDCEEDKIALDAKGILKKFSDKYDMSFETCVKRRAKVPMVVFDASDLNDTEGGTEFSSHLYSKATHNFDEGSSSGLLMQNAVVSRCGRRYMLHNNCRCRERRDDKCNGEDLNRVWNGIEESERIGVFNVNTVVKDDEQMSVTSDSTRQFALSQSSQDTTFESKVNPSMVQKNIETVIEEVLKEGGNRKLFQWRRKLQEKLKINTKQFIALMAHSLREWDHFLCRSLIRQTILPPRVSYINRISDVRSGLTYAPIADELEPFEESFCWKVCQLRWKEMNNAGRAKTLQSIPDEHSNYNFFFARSNEQLSVEPDDVLSSLPVCRFMGEVQDFQEIHKDATSIAGEDHKALAGVLESVRVGKGDSLFKRKGHDFGRLIAQIPIATPMKKMEQTRQLQDLGSERLGTIIQSEVDDALSLDGTTSMNCNDEMDVEMDADTEVASTHVDENDDLNSMRSHQFGDKFDKRERLRLESGMLSERSEAASAYGDLHFVDEKRVAIMAYSIVNDETHWKKRKLDKDVINVVKEKPPQKVEKTERKKPKKDDAKDNFEIGNFDRLPLSVIRDRQKQARRAASLLRREDEVLRAPHTRIATELLYKPEQFCRLAHVFMGEWGNIRFNRASSLSGAACGSNLSKVLHDSISEEVMAENAIKNHLSVFNDYFENSCVEKCSAPESCQQQDNDLNHDTKSVHSDDTTFAFDNDLDNEAEIRVKRGTVLKASQSFYSDVDSDSEEAEMFGVKYSVRQRRINAPAVKRALVAILSNAKLDADVLSNELGSARKNGILDLDDSKNTGVVSNDSAMNLTSVDNEEQEQQLKEEEDMNEDVTCELRHTEVAVSDFKLSGRHTFSSILSRLPSYLAGRTADDLSPISAFSVLLHLCNENNLELLQAKDENGLVKTLGMGDFTIASANNGPNSRKRMASGCD